MASPIFGEATKAFETHLSAPPQFAVLAPGRVNVIGEHIDYNGGFVLPAAIDKHLLLLARARTDGVVRLAAKWFPEVQVEFSLDEWAPGDKGWERYVKGVLAGMRDAGVELKGFDAYVDSTLPIGGGLSSSAALEAAFALLVDHLAGAKLDRMHLAKICQKAEHVYAGVPCGIMDQAAVLNCVKDQLLFLDCEEETFKLVPFNLEGWELMIIDSRAAHELADGEYGKRRAGCEKAAQVLGLSLLGHLPTADLAEALAHPNLSAEQKAYTRHVVTEIERTHQAVEALRAGEVETLGTLLNQSHASLRDDFKVSCVELDVIAEIAQKLPGVAGCRMTGGGFGGSCVALVRKAAVETISRELIGQFEARFGYEPNLFTTSLAQGAVLVEL